MYRVKTTQETNHEAVIFELTKAVSCLHTLLEDAHNNCMTSNLYMNNALQSLYAQIGYEVLLHRLGQEQEATYQEPSHLLLGLKNSISACFNDLSRNLDQTVRHTYFAALSKRLDIQNWLERSERKLFALRKEALLRGFAEAV